MLLYALGEDFHGDGGILLQAEHRLGNEETAHVGRDIDEKPGVIFPVEAAAAYNLTPPAVKRMPGIVHHDDIAEVHTLFLLVGNVCVPETAPVRKKMLSV